MSNTFEECMEVGEKRFKSQRTVQLGELHPVKGKYGYNYVSVERCEEKKVVQVKVDNKKKCKSKRKSKHKRKKNEKQ